VISGEGTPASVRRDAGRASASARLLPACALGQSTHEVTLASPEEVDDEVVSLLAAAYQQN